MSNPVLEASTLPEGYRYAWKFCFMPTWFEGRKLWLCFIPVIQRLVRRSVKSGLLNLCNQETWETVYLGVPHRSASKGDPMPEV